jgi:hypothetical protein
VSQLSGNSKLFVHDLHSKYKDPGNLDKALTAQSKLDQVTDIMKSNVSKIF